MPYGETGPSQADWRKGLTAFDDQLARQLEEDPDTYQRIIRLGLAAPVSVELSTIHDFWTDPHEAKRRLVERGINNFHVRLMPPRSEPGWPKYRNIDAPLAEGGVEQYVADSANDIPPERHQAYSVTIAEYMIAIAGVKMIINPSGYFGLDIVRGDMGKVGTGYQTPDYEGNTDPDTGVLRYRSIRATDDPVLPRGPVRGDSFLNPPMRQALWSAISAIPVIEDDSDIRKRRMPGDYEFVILERNHGLGHVYLNAIPLTGANPAVALPESDPRF